MELALSTLFCLKRPLEEALPEIIRSRTRLIELVDAGPHTLTQIYVERLLDAKSSYDLSYALHAPFADINIAADDAFIREALLRRLETSIRWASALEAQTLVFHPGNSTAVERFSPGSAWRHNLESIRRLVRYADNYGVEIMVENVPEPFPYVLKSVRDFERFFDEAGDEIRMVLDVAHANIRGEIEGFVKSFGDRIEHVHVSDNDGESDVHLQIGEGSIDWEETMGMLKESKFDGWVTVESYNGVDESLAFLERLI